MNKLSHIQVDVADKKVQAVLSSVPTRDLIQVTNWKICKSFLSNVVHTLLRLLSKVGNGETYMQIPMSPPFTVL
jgi:hypothetical protein